MSNLLCLDFDVLCHMLSIAPEIGLPLRSTCMHLRSLIPAKYRQASVFAAIRQGGRLLEWYLNSKWIFNNQEYQQAIIYGVTEILRHQRNRLSLNLTAWSIAQNKSGYSYDFYQARQMQHCLPTVLEIIQAKNWSLLARFQGQLEQYCNALVVANQWKTIRRCCPSYHRSSNYKILYALKHQQTHKIGREIYQINHPDDAKTLINICDQSNQYEWLLSHLEILASDFYDCLLSFRRSDLLLYFYHPMITYGIKVAKYALTFVSEDFLRLHWTFLTSKSPVVSIKRCIAKFNRPDLHRWACEMSDESFNFQLNLALLKGGSLKLLQQYRSNLSIMDAQILIQQCVKVCPHRSFKMIHCTHVETVAHIFSQTTPQIEDFQGLSIIPAAFLKLLPETMASELFGPISLNHDQANEYRYGRLEYIRSYIIKHRPEDYFAYQRLLYSLLVPTSIRRDLH